MKKFHVYDIYADDGRDVYKFTVPAPTQKEAVNFVQGNGEVIAVRDSMLQDIDLGCLTDSLTRCGWGRMEIDVITRALAMVGLDR